MTENKRSHTIRLNQIWFDYIENGEKLYEGRLNSDRHKKYYIGDNLTFIRRPDQGASKDIPLRQCVSTITNIEYFHSYYDALSWAKEKNILHQVLPNISSVDEGCDVYFQWDSQEDQDKYGVMLIKIKTV